MKLSRVSAGFLRVFAILGQQKTYRVERGEVENLSARKTEGIFGEGTFFLGEGKGWGLRGEGHQ